MGAVSDRDDRVFKCPRCGREVKSDCPHLPFCSERCRMIDFGTWLEGGFRIDGEYRDDIKGDE